MKQYKLCCLVMALLLAAVMTACGQEEPVPPSPYRTESITLEVYQNGQVFDATLIEYRYDSQGNATDMIITSADGSTEHSQYILDEQGNALQEIRISGENTSVTDFELTYDSQGRVTKEVASTDGVVSSITETGYDKNGKIIQLDITRCIPDDAEIISKSSYQYDKDGNVVLETVIWNDDPPVEQKTTYDASGRAVKAVQTDASGEVESYNEYSYDETGLVKTSVAYSADGTEQGRTITVYDENDLILSVETYFDGQLQNKSTYTYLTIEEE